MIRQLQSFLGRAKSPSKSVGILDLDNELDAGRRLILDDYRQNKDSLEEQDLTYLIEYFRSLQQSEDEREKQIEGKAGTLIAVTGLTGGFIATTLQSLLNAIQASPLWLIILIGILYVAIAIVLLWTIIRALQALEVGSSTFASDDPRELFKLRKDNHKKIYQEYTKDLLGTQLYNQMQINKKAGYVIAAQKNYVISVFLTAILVSLMLFSWMLSVTIRGETSPSAISSPTIQVNTATSQPTAKNTGTISATVDLTLQAPTTP